MSAAEPGCPSCGAPLVERQRWCVACGAGLGTMLAATPRRALGVAAAAALVAMLALAGIGYAVATLVSS
jgi:hypothetical protein